MAVLTLALGIGSCTAIFSVVKSVLLRPLPYPDSASLVVVAETESSQLQQERVASGNYADWRQQSTSFQNLAAVRLGVFNLAGAIEPTTVIGEHVTPNYLSTLRALPVLGRDFSASEAATNANVVLLSHAFWLRQFGGRRDAVNKTLRIDNAPFTIVGVLPENIDHGELDGRLTAMLASQTARVDIFTLSPYPSGKLDREGHNLEVFGRLKPGATVEQARRELSLIAGRLEKQYPATNRGRGITLTPMLEETVGASRSMLCSLLGAVGFMFLIACANVANLLFARATSRTKEIAVRVALGATRSRIIRQLLTESVLLALIGGALGVLAAYWGLKALVACAPLTLPRAQEIGLDNSALIFTCALAVVTGLGFGLLPAFQASHVSLNISLKDGGRGSGFRGRRMRSSLVVFEIAMALVLLVGAGLLIQGFVRLQKVDPGFRPAGAMALTLQLSAVKYHNPAERVAFVDALVGQLEKLHGAESAGATSILPFSVGETTYGFAMAGQQVPPFPSNQQTDVYAVTPDYLRVMGVPLLRGRSFTARDRANSSRVVIINESMAKMFFPDMDPIGQHLKFESYGGGPSEIIGIAGDVKTERLDEKVKLQTYEPLAQHPPTFLTVVVRASGTAIDLPASLRASVHSLDLDQPVWTLRPLTDLLAASVARERFGMFLFIVFSCAALLLATTGIYGVMAYAVTQRTSEIGIRMALGAKRSNVLVLILLQGSRLLGTGLACGVVGALLLTRLIAAMLFGVSPYDPLTFAVIIGLLAAAGTIACVVPAWRAAKLDPIVALRSE